MKSDKTPIYVVAGIILVAVLGTGYFYTVNTAFVIHNRDSHVSDGIAVRPDDFVSDQADIYEFAPASDDGIGKIYLGREISQVMGHPAIGWLERTSREQEESVAKAIGLLDLAPDTVIADIGAGSGYYSFRIARHLKEGNVVAVDIQQEMLDFLEKRILVEGIANVTTALGKVDDIGLAPESLDAALMVDAYHEFSHPAEMLRSIYLALKPGGRIYLLEYRAEDPKVPIKALHKMTEAQAVKEFEANGFSFVENRSGLPWQHLLVFEK